MIKSGICKVIYPQDCSEWERIAEFLTDYVSERTGYRVFVIE